MGEKIWSLLHRPLVALALLCTAAGVAHTQSANGPKLTVCVYGFGEISPWIVRGGEAEASRVLRPTNIQINWIQDRLHPDMAACLPGKSSYLVVRILPRALPQAGATALGMTASTDGAGAAFVFYDRLIALRTHTRLLTTMLGRVMAHEITHVLLPDQPHSKVGLMRAEWGAEDLQISSSACMGLPLHSVQLMQREVLRRALSKQTN